MSVFREILLALTEGSILLLLAWMVAESVVLLIRVGRRLAQRRHFRRLVADWTVEGPYQGRVQASGPVTASADAVRASPPAASADAQAPVGAAERGAAPAGPNPRPSDG